MLKTLNKNSVTVDRKQLIGILTHLKNVRPSRTTAKQWQSGRVVVREGKTYLAANNSEQYVELPIADYALFDEPQEIVSEFKIDKTLKVAKALKDTDVSIKVKEGEFILEGEKTSLQQDAEFKDKMWESPPLEFEPNELEFLDSATFEIEEFSTALRETWVSTSYEKGRYYLNGVLLWFNKKGLTLAATDGSHMTQRRIKTGCDTLECEHILPNEAVKILLGICKGKIGKVVAKFIDSRIVFGFDDGTVFYTRFIDGKFPDYRRVIPKNQGLFISFDKKELSEALRLFSKESFKRELINAEYTDEGFFIWRKSEGAKFETKIGCNIEHVNGEKDLKCCLNAKAIQTLVDNSKGDRVIISFDKPGYNDSPITIKGSDQNLKDDLSVLMPVRIKCFQER